MPLLSFIPSFSSASSGFGDYTPLYAPVRLRCGCRVPAVDGSAVALPDMPKLLEASGGTGRSADVPTARASIFYI
jgi:hypothetical protein